MKPPAGYALQAAPVSWTCRVSLWDRQAGGRAGGGRAGGVQACVECRPWHWLMAQPDLTTDIDVEAKTPMR